MAKDIERLSAWRYLKYRSYSYSYFLRFVLLYLGRFIPFIKKGLGSAISSAGFFDAGIERVVSFFGSIANFLSISRKDGSF